MPSQEAIDTFVDSEEYLNANFDPSTKTMEHLKAVFRKHKVQFSYKDYKGDLVKRFQDYFQSDEDEDIIISASQLKKERSSVDSKPIPEPRTFIGAANSDKRVASIKARAKIAAAVKQVRPQSQSQSQKTAASSSTSEQDSHYYRAFLQVKDEKDRLVEQNAQLQNEIMELISWLESLLDNKDEETPGEKIDDDQTYASRNDRKKSFAAVKLEHDELYSRNAKIQPKPKEINVSRIYESRLTGRLRSIEYFIKLEGDSEMTWESGAKLSHLGGMVADFHRRNPDMPSPWDEDK